MNQDLKDVKVLAFDVFGTIVDWHGSIAAEIRGMGYEVDEDAFANRWREGYKPAMAKVMAESAWVRLDDLHRSILDQVLMEYELDLDEAERTHLNLVWHRLNPWPDCVAGLARLKSRYTICSLSNGNIGLLTNLSKHGALPWDCILSAEIFRKYKPHPDTYLGVARIFDLDPGEVMLVAAHHDDLEAARECGLRTAYIERPFEFGVNKPKSVLPVDDNDLHARDLVHLSEILGIQ